MQQPNVLPVDMKVLMNHIYEYQKGVRRMVLFTLNRKYEEFAIRRLESQNISYIVQPVAVTASICISAGRNVSTPYG